MSLIVIRRRTSCLKFFMNSTRPTSCLQRRNHYIMSARSTKLFLGSGCQNESNSHQESSCLQSRNQLFLGSGCQNESNSHQLARIGEKKIFHELDLHNVYKVGITCFCAQDAKMSPTVISSLESARRKFFMNSTYIMSTK